MALVTWVCLFLIDHSNMAPAPHALQLNEQEINTLEASSHNTTSQADSLTFRYRLEGHICPQPVRTRMHMTLACLRSQGMPGYSFWCSIAALQLCQGSFISTFPITTPQERNTGVGGTAHAWQSCRVVELDRARGSSIKRVVQDSHHTSSVVRPVTQLLSISQQQCVF